MPNHILAIDQGTTSSRASIFDREGRVCGKGQREFRQYYPQSGWVEHDPNEIWSSQVGVMAEAIAEANLDVRDIAAIGITNQRETTLVWDRKTGEPIHPAIVWQDRRTATRCDSLRSAGHADMIRRKTGLVIDAYFSATKLSWILDNVAEARQRAVAGKLAFGTIDTWLVWKLSGGTAHVTDVSNASRTLLYNIHTHAWDEELLSLFDIPRSILPEVKSSSEVYAMTSPTLFGVEIPIAGIAGDQQAALFGQMCLHPGMSKQTYGTGGFMMFNTGAEPIDSGGHLLTTIAWELDGKITYALEGSVFVAGAVVQWLRDGLGIIKSSGEIEALAASVPDNGGVYFVPAFVGLGAPHWDAYARGAILGLSRGTTSGHIARAAIESIAFQTADIVEAMEADAKLHLKELRVDGGATVNNSLLQFQADICQRPIVRPAITETTALGAAYLAGLAVKFWNGTGELESQWKRDRIFEPHMTRDEAESLKSQWRKAVGRSKEWLSD